MTSITRVHKPPSKRERWAWKCFSLLQGGGLGYYVVDTREPLERGKWLKAECDPLTGGWSNKQEAGFHVFRLKKEAEDYIKGSRYLNDVILKVKVRGITQEGLQLPIFHTLSAPIIPCFRALEMFIPRPRRKKQPIAKART